MVPRVKDNNPFGTQKTVSLDWLVRTAEETPFWVFDLQRLNLFDLKFVINGKCLFHVFINVKCEKK